MTTTSTPVVPTRARLALVLACGATFLSFLDATVTNLALPQVADDFEVGVTGLSWVVTAYAIPFAALLAPAGAVADAVGRIRLYAVGVTLFTVASLLAALAPAYPFLLTGRVLQGVGAALLVPASLGMVLAEVPPERRRAAIGLWSAAGALAAAAGPTVGGLAVEVVGWRALFLLNLPLGLWLLIRSRTLVAGDTRSGRAPDPVGATLLVLAIAGVVHGLVEGSERGWAAPYVVSVLAIAVAAGAAAVVRSARQVRPALRVDLWRSSPAFTVATIASWAYGAVLFATLMLGVLFLVGVWGYSELRAGLAMTPTALVTAIVAVGAGRLARPPSPRTLVSVGFLVLAVVYAVIAAAITPEPQFLALWLPTGLAMGVGIGLATVGVSTAAALSVAPQHFAAATGLVMAARQVGGAVGVAAVAVILAGVVGVDAASPYAVSYGAAAAVAVAAAAAGFGLRIAAPATDAEVQR